MSATTRRCLAPHLTPYQLQKPPALVLFHFHEGSSGLWLWWPPPIAAALNASSAAPSPAACAATATRINMDTEAYSSCGGASSCKISERTATPDA